MRQRSIQPEPGQPGWFLELEREERTCSVPQRELAREPQRRPGFSSCSSAEAGEALPAPDQTAAVSDGSVIGEIHRRPGVQVAAAEARSNAHRGAAYRDGARS
jgi:hypothetical protein